jgi:hypothetical protein
VKAETERACDTAAVGDRFGWEMINGDRVEGEVIEIDSNVVVIRDQFGEQHCYEA